MNAEEIQVYIKLKHPDPHTDLFGFLDSLPEDFVDKFYTKKNYTREEKIARAYDFFRVLSGKIPGLLQLLSEYYSKKFTQSETTIVQ